MQNKCFWEDESYVRSPHLQGAHSTDFLIVGAGVAGLFTAHFLLKRGVKPENILIIEQAEVGSGSTGHSAGMLISDIETAPWSKVHAVYGEEGASLYYEAQKNALDEIESIITSAHIACDFARQDYLIVSGDEVGKKKVCLEFATHRTLGDVANKLLSGVTFSDELQTPLYTMGERLEKGISVNPLAFVRGVASHLGAQGVRIYEGTRLLSAESGCARTAEGEIAFRHIVHAEGVGVRNDLVQNFATTIVVSRLLSDDELARLHLLDKDMFVDTETPSFRYVKVTGDNRLLIGSGDEPTESTSSWASLDTGMVEKLQIFLDAFMSAHVELDYGWTGVFSLSKDALPLVKEDKTDVVIAGMGTQVACVAVADYIAARLLEEKHPLQGIQFQKVPS